MTGIYDDPAAYDLACSFREVPPEVAVLLSWCARHRPDGAPPVRSVLELAAGPAEHAREFARRGVAATALDLHPAMCAYAAERAAADGVALEVVRDDMTAFSLARRFDLVVTMLDSTSHLMTLDAFTAHLDRAAAHLADGGLYIVEMAHPRDRIGDAPSVSTSWTVEGPGVRASVRWGEPDDRLDPVTQIAADRVTMTITGAGARVVEDVVPYRFWTATELAAAVRLSGALEVVAQYGDFGDVALTDPHAWRMITVLRPVPRPAG
ncbi:class I SAM-dependent methyltransferase [Actinomadura parmotrematis]|uniref:Class I SAM-dependent methyltransferase n=1 Tax=Actinomadura parmotrematis TaxID=2864039 RepID=A0ABS7FS55_9ACTN|nr:class I SAM-dependent methyltransferase [Actinomadura parmotrematis]MBW8483227.1 class I SAM-dependent methyltransferase [Actinomadura parmotrematis]